MKLCKFILRALSGIVNTAVLAFCLLLFTYGCYAVWDSRQLTQAADAAQYAIYKPTDKDARSFAELQEINPDVFGWLNVYGTNIDYPLVQGEDNSKYVSTNVDGEYSLVGSLFLDCRNRKDFSDFNSIIYGHHMAEDQMFGDIGDFQEKAFFDSHQYGTLFYGGKTWGLEFFAFLEADAYDEIYSPQGEGQESRQAYLNHIRDLALYTRDVSVSVEDHLVLLSTCTSDVTNGRHLLAGRITQSVRPDPFWQEQEEKQIKGIEAESLRERLEKIPFAGKAASVIVLLLVFKAGGSVICKKWKKRKR